MQELVKQANIYISSKKDKKESPNHQLLEGIAKYLTHMLKVFGAIDEDQAIGFPVAGKNSAANVRSASIFFVQCLCFAKQRGHESVFSFFVNSSIWGLIKAIKINQSALNVNKCYHS